MSPQKIPDHLLNALQKFISITYSSNMPNSLLVAQSFMLKYPDFGKEFGLMEINKIVEEGIKRGFFK